jgi:TM2 domain-containing membrane protein YozV
MNDYGMPGGPQGSPYPQGGPVPPAGQPGPQFGAQPGPPPFNPQPGPGPQYGQQPYMGQPQVQVQGKVRSPGIGSAKKDKWVAFILGLPPFGALGIHKFYLGYKTEGIIMLVISLVGMVCTFGLGLLVMEIIALIEAVRYVTKTQEDFERTYIQDYKGWM